jgi:hypothetical protein
MKRVLIFLVLFVPILLAVLYLTGDLRRIARLPGLKVEKEEPPLSEELLKTDKGFIVRSVGRWSVRRYAEDTLKLLWSAEGERADALDERRFTVSRIDSVFFEYDKEGENKWRSNLYADKGKVEILDDGSYLAELSGVQAEGFPKDAKVNKILLKTDGLNVKVSQGKERVGELMTDLPVEIVLDEMRIKGTGLKANTSLKRMVLEKDVSITGATSTSEEVTAKANHLGFQSVEDGGYELRLSGDVSVSLLPSQVPRSFARSPLTLQSDLARIKISKDGKVEGMESSGKVVLKRQEEPFVYAKDAVYVPDARTITLHGPPSVMFAQGENELFANEAICEIPETEEAPIRLRFIDEVVAKITTRQGEKEERIILKTDDAYLVLKTDKQDDKTYLETVTCPKDVVLESPLRKMCVKTSGLKARLTKGVFEECESGQSRLETENMSAKGNGLKLAEKERLLTLSGDVKSEIRLKDGNIELECEKLVVHFADEQYTLGSVEAEEVKKCILHRKGVSDITISTEHLAYDAVNEKLSFGDGIVGLVCDDNEFRITALKIDTKNLVATGGKINGVMVAKNFKGDISADSVLLDFGAEGLRKAHFEKNVHFSSENFSVSSETLDYDSPAQEVCLKKVELQTKQQDLKLTSEEGFIYLPLRRAEFEGSPKVNGSKDGQNWKIESERIVLIYRETSETQVESVEAVYAENKVVVEVQEKEGKTARLSCDKCVYLRESGKVSIVGQPAVIEREGATLKESAFIYDVARQTIETTVKEQSYDWELDPLKLKERKKKKE